MATKQEDGKAAGKWAASLTEVISAPLDKVWEFLSDFDGVQKNYPHLLSSCKTTEGEKNKVGSVRTVRTVAVPTSDGTPSESKEKLLVLDNEEGTSFEAKERLLVLDNEKHIISYTVVDKPFLIEYKSTFTAEKHENDKTRVKWEYECNPTSVMTEESLTGQSKAFVTAILTTIGQKLSK